MNKQAKLYSNEEDYAAPETWKIIEIISSVSAPYWSGSYVKIIKEYLEGANIRIRDLGCGTGYLSKIILDKLKLNNIQYQGIDLDKHALSVAGERFGSLDNCFFERAHALSNIEEINQCSSPNFIMCFSNTFLCLGSFDDILFYLRDLRLSSQATRPTLIFSVVPWDNNRVAANVSFDKWTRIKGPSDECFVRIDASLNQGYVEQNIFLKKNINDENTHFLKHRFLALEPKEIESLFHQSGWSIECWRSPIDATIVDPNKSHLPEFIIVCK